MSDIILCNGDLNRDYEVIDVVSSSEFIKEKLFDSSSLDEVFARLKENLKKYCRALGGNAVINCKFKYDVQPVNTGVVSWGWHARRVVSAVVYGTAVKFE